MRLEINEIIYGKNNPQEKRLYNRAIYAVSDNGKYDELVALVSYNGRVEFPIESPFRNLEFDIVFEALQRQEYVSDNFHNVELVIHEGEKNIKFHLLDSKKEVDAFVNSEYTGEKKPGIVNTSLSPFYTRFISSLKKENKECLFEIKDLKKYNTYSGLRYNGVDYECSQVLCGVNQYNAQILGFITDDGEVIDINDKMLDGIFLIEGDINKKFDSRFLISPSEVEAPYIEGEDFEEQFNDERVKHAFGDWQVLFYSKENDMVIERLHFLTYNNMRCYLQEKLGVSDKLMERLPQADEIFGEDVSGSITFDDEMGLFIFGSEFSCASRSKKMIEDEEAQYGIISVNKKQRR